MGPRWRLIASYLWIPSAIFALLLVVKFGVANVHWDAFATAEELMRLRQKGYPTFDLLFEQHNEHRMAVPRVVLFAITAFMRWDSRIEMLLGWGTIGLTVLALRRIARKTVPDASAAAWTMAIGGTLLFSLTQWQNMLLGFHWYLFLPAFFLVAVIWVMFLPTFYIWRVLAGLVVMVVGTYTNANALLLGPLLLACVLAAPEATGVQRVLAGIVWTVVSAANIGCYFIGFVRPKLPPLPGATEPGLIEMVWWVCGFVGNGFRVVGSDLNALGCLGAGVIALWLACGVVGFGIAAKRKDGELLGQLMPWWIMGASVVLSGAMAAVGRAASGQPPYQDRYANYPMLLLAACIPLTYLVMRRLWPGRLALPPTAAGVVAGLVLSPMLLAQQPSISAARQHRTRMEGCRNLEMFTLVAPNPEQFVRDVYPSTAGMDVINRVSKFDILRFPIMSKPFAEDYGPASAQAIGALDHVILQDGQLTVLGWAFAPNHVSASAVMIGVKGPDGRSKLLTMTVDTRNRRADVAAVVGPPHQPDCGWAVRIADPHLPPGSELTAWVLDGKALTLSPIGLPKHLPK